MFGSYQEHPGDIVVDDAMAIEEPDEPDLDDQAGALFEHDGKKEAISCMYNTCMYTLHVYCIHK